MPENTPTPPSGRDGARPSKSPNMEGWPPCRPPSENGKDAHRVPPPFFIVGCPRSGTTLLQVLIEQHPAIAIPPESFLFLRFTPFAAMYGDLAQPGNLQRLVRELLADERVRDWSLGIRPEDFIQRLPPAPTLKDVIAGIFRLYAEQQGKARWGDKTPQHAMSLPEIKALFPEAKILHLVRDGRDVAESMSRITIGPCSVYGIARRWDRFVRTTRNFAASMDPKNYLEIRFEDLVQAPEETRRRVFEFLEEDPALCSAVTDRVPDTASRRQAVSAAQHHAGLKGIISREKIGVFQTRFTPRELAVFEWVAGDSLKALGYTLVSNPPSAPTLKEKLGYAFQDSVVRYSRKFFQKSVVRQLSKEIRLDLEVRLRRLRFSMCAK